MTDTQIVATLDIRGQEFPVELRVARDGNSADFVVDALGVTARGETLAEVREKLMRETKKKAVKVEVPFTSKDGRDGVATGVHAGTGKILVRTTDRWGKSVSTQLDSYGSSVYRPLSDGEKAELARLRKARKEADDAHRTWEKDREVYLPKAVREAIEKAVNSE